MLLRGRFTKNSVRLIALSIIVTLPLSYIHAVPTSIAVPSMQEGIIKLGKWQKLIDYINKNSSLDLNLKIVKDHTEIMYGLEKHLYDFAYTDPLWYEMLNRKNLCIPLARAVIDGRQSVSSVLIVNKDSIILKIKDLKGKIIALSYKNDSALGYFIPIVILKSYNFSPSDFKSIVLSDSYMSILKGVAFGKLDAGFVSSSIFLKQNSIAFNNLKKETRVIAVSKPIPQWTLIARKDLRENSVNTLKRLILSMQESPEGLKVLKDTGFSTFKRIKDTDYNTIKYYLNRLDKEYVPAE